MKFIAALATLVLAAVASGQTMPTPYNCATGPTQIAITSFTLSPYPLCINQMVCATGTGTLSTPVIQGSTLSITGRYLGRLIGVALRVVAVNGDGGTLFCQAADGVVAKTCP
ncbi:hypothetical protein BGZ91_008747 [Linnemannia elongata]|nr:hypothetical protein BGZ91_008747 [Linnemannia elongata]